MITIKEVWKIMWSRIMVVSHRTKTTDERSVEASQRERVDRETARLTRETERMRISLELLSDRTANVQGKGGDGSQEAVER